MSFLVITFIVSGDNDYGALSFKGSGKTIEEINDYMDEHDVTSVRAEDFDLEDDWEVNFHGDLEVPTKEMAEKVVSLIDSVAGEGGTGDYDALKHTSYEFLIVELEE